MRLLSILVLCNDKENERIKELLYERYDTRLTTFREPEYYKFIQYINDNPNIDLIIIENSINNKISIINRYKDKKMINKTIIIDDIKLECYKYIDTKYNLFNILPCNYNKDLLYTCIDMVKRINIDINIPLYQKISHILEKTNLPNNKIGYKYIRKAIYESYNNPSLRTNFNNKLYPLLSRIYKKSKASIERAIRTTITTSINKMNNEFNNKLFSKYITYDKTTPTNQEFILTIVNNLQVEYGNIID